MSGQRKGFMAAGLIAGIAFIVKGILELRHGPGAALVFIGVVILAAIALRAFVFRD